MQVILISDLSKTGSGVEAGQRSKWWECFELRFFLLLPNLNRLERMLYQNMHVKVCACSWYRLVYYFNINLCCAAHKVKGLGNTRLFRYVFKQSFYVLKCYSYLRRLKKVGNRLLIAFCHLALIYFTRNAWSYVEFLLYQRST